jgi:aerobic carbon-monoxide dehydrogenase large subunit
MTDTTGKRKYIGESLPRLEDVPLLSGQGRFADDISFPHQLHMRVVRSEHAHARIKSIDCEAARVMPGVFAVWSAADIPDVPRIELRDGSEEALLRCCQPVLANEKLRYVGDPIAAVFAEDPYLAEDAAELVVVEIEELPVILSALEPPGEFSSGVSTEPTVLHKGYGDIEAAFRNAAHVIELELSVGRQSGVALETRGAIARYDKARDILELHGAAKVPHRNRDLLARWLGRSPASVHLFEGHVGGGFGVRGELYPEDLLVCVAALRLGRPIKWIEDRRENLIATNHARAQHHVVRAAVDADGHVLAIDDVFFYDQGAYVRTHGARMVDLTASMLPGPYRVPAYRIAGHYRLTNKTPGGNYRSPGRTEGTFVRERLFDAIAHKLGVDRIELRRRNLIDKSEMPFDRGVRTVGEEVIYDSGDYAGLLNKALAAAGWDALQAELVRRRAAGEIIGAGLGMFVEESGLGPTDGVRISVDATGAVEVLTGSASVGQGVETVMAQICADTLGVDYRRIRVVHGRTDRIPHGVGAHASRATVMTGSATHAAALKLRAKALDVAADLLQASPEVLDIIDGRVVRIDRPAGPSITLAEVAVSLAPASPLRGERDPGLVAEGWFQTELMNYGYGIHIAVVRVDPETGAVTVERCLIAIDVGRAINPMLIQGQTVGGFAQGLGGALLEEFTYDARGQPRNVTLADYLVPTLHEMPLVDVLITEDAPSPRNPLGLKGAGEAGVTGAAAAIAGAVDDAIRAATNKAVRITRVPITPDHVKALLGKRAQR